MGQEVSHAHFNDDEFNQFAERLTRETALLKNKIENAAFSDHEPVGGFEIEAWLLDKELRPAPLNEKFFEIFDNPLATPELAKFNIELNNQPLNLKGDALTRFEKDLLCVFNEAERAAHSIDTDIIMIGTLPTLQSSDCCIANMSAMKRYKALNECIIKARGGKPLKLDIEGQDHLQLTQQTVMMEAATTSFQIHLQTPLALAHHYYNASLIASAPIMAISGNSPFLFNKQLWHETRIPLFEQAVHAGNGLQRVSFGTGYAEASIYECFAENLQDFPVLLPMLFDDKPDAFSHLRLHNGVIWRWNRPLVGFDKDGTPHIRIEHRILPAGPSIVDMVANAAFYYGLTQTLTQQLKANLPSSDVSYPEMPFQQAKDNFYRAAKMGLQAEIVWNGKNYSGSGLQRLILDRFIPDAQNGLQQLGITQSSIDYYLGIISQRVITGQTGAIWQISQLQKKQGDARSLLKAYLHHQRQNLPVHEWKL